MGQVERGVCLCCASEPITVKNFDIGHVVAFSRGGSNEIGNLRPVSCRQAGGAERVELRSAPICGHCNNSMGTQHMGDYQRSVYPDAPAICGEDPVGSAVLADTVLTGGGAEGGTEGVPRADGTVYITMEHVEAIQPVVARPAGRESNNNSCQQYSFCLVVIIAVTFVVLMVV
jgi:hypothetical protein